MNRYRRILRHGEAARPFAAAVLARLPVSMVPLGMVLLVQQVSGSYGAAGVVTAVFALATSLTAPVWGRLLDVLGQPRVVAPTSLASAACLTAFALAAVSGASPGALVALAAGVGLAFPPMSSAMRAAWRVVLTAEDDRRAAYALDAVAVEAVFVVGPLVVSALLVLTPPAVPLLVTAGLLAAGGVLYSATRAARDWRAEPHLGAHGHQGRSPLATRGVLPVLLVALAMAVGFGQLDVAVPATAREALGQAAAVGWLFTAIAGGSVAGGLAYGSRHWAGVERRRLPVPLAGFAVGLVALFLAARFGRAHLTVLLPVLLLTGLSIAPTLIMQANLVDHLAPRDRFGEAQAWLSTAFTSGGAAGAAVAGVLIDAAGPSRAFLGAAGAVILATVGAVLAQPLLRGADRHEHPPAPPG